MYPGDYRTGDEFDCEADAKAYEYTDSEGKTVYCPLRGTPEEIEAWEENRRNND